MAALAGLFIYPIKSLGAVSLGEARVEARGLAYDRRWMLVDEAGVFLTQRDHPALARLRQILAAPFLQVEAAGREPLCLPLEGLRGSVRRARVWKDTVEVVEAGAAADAWFSDYLGRACRLVYLPADSRRPVDPAYGTEEDEVSLADGYPVLLTARASLADLNDRLSEPVPMDRFRPNVVVAGTAPFAEDGWARIRIGGGRFRVVKPCARCVVTTIDQANGEAGKEPLRTLGAFRRSGSKVLFGQNLIPDGEAVLRLGDPVIVEEVR